MHKGGGDCSDMGVMQCCRGSHCAISTGFLPPPPATLLFSLLRQRVYMFYRQPQGLVGESKHMFYLPPICICTLWHFNTYLLKQANLTIGCSTCLFGMTALALMVGDRIVASIITWVFSDGLQDWFFSPSVSGLWAFGTLYWVSSLT